MKAEELRIGNLINEKFFLEEPINFVESKIVGEKLEVKKVDYSIIYTLSQGAKHYYLPIPLTPEWLERFDKISWLSHDVGGYFFWFNGEKKYIKFLHNLQNVYFHIENIELCLDTKTQNT